MINIDIKKLQIKTNKSIELIDITQKINDFIRESDIKNGFLLVYTKHTTTGIIINENEGRLLEDIKNTLQKLVPRGIGYKHDQIDNNAHSHILATLIGNSISIPIINSSLALGTWQSILFVELDGPRNRTIILQLFF
ncbi:MAG: secondary thiamine-phosphate synthase enzyme YjbQ [Candidatus Helarchaeota archaeon]